MGRVLQDIVRAIPRIFEAPSPSQSLPCQRFPLERQGPPQRSQRVLAIMTHDVGALGRAPDVRLAVRVRLRVHRGDARVRRERFIQSRSAGLRRANQKQIRQTRRRTTLVILIIISVIPSDIIEIPELLLRLLPISFKGFRYWFRIDFKVGQNPPGLIKMYYFQADVFLKLDSPSKQFQRLWYFGLVKQQGRQQQYRRDCFFRTS